MLHVGSGLSDGDSAGETLTGATVAATRYIRNSPAIRALMVRTGAGMFFASAPFDEYHETERAHLVQCSAPVSSRSSYRSLREGWPSECNLGPLLPKEQGSRELSYSLA